MQIGKQTASGFVPIGAQGKARLSFSFSRAVKVGTHVVYPAAHPKSYKEPVS